MFSRVSAFSNTQRIERSSSMIQTGFMRYGRIVMIVEFAAFHSVAIPLRRIGQQDA